MRYHPFPLCLLVVLLLLTPFTGCETTPSLSGGPPSVEITSALIPKGQYGRWRTRSMRPRYITIHSTQNFGSGADARTHANLLQRGGLKGSKNSLGFITWHYTVDENSIYQSLPDNEQGQHADYEGDGNRYSIGIEMCEHAGNDRAATLDRTARLAAYLMKKHGIPLDHIVPHQHWRRIRYADGRDLGHKNCPHFLLDDGKPGAKWQAFLEQVNSYAR